MLTITTKLFAQQGTSVSKSVFISKIPKPKAPANLIVTNITFTDAEGNNNNRLDADEKTKIFFTLKNIGKGDAFSCKMSLNELMGIKGIVFQPQQDLGNLKSGDYLNISVPIEGTMQLETGTARFKANITEGNSFNADPFEIVVNTQKFLNPQLAIVDYLFTSEEVGKVKTGQIVNLKLVVQNKGQGKAFDVNVNIKNPVNVFPADKMEFTFKALSPNENQIINYEFFTNKQYSGFEIPIEVSIIENYKKYGVNQTLKVSLDQTLLKTQKVEIVSNPINETVISDVSLLSDVDKNIPINVVENENRYALVIGNENYSRYQTGLNSESNVEYANNDARIFAEYCEKTLGVPIENITLLTDAIGSKMKSEIEKIRKIAQYSNGKAEIIFYFAGHGFPDEITKEAFIMPVDISGTNVTDGVKLSDLYESLTSNPSQRVTVFLDACFSGGGRNQGLLASRGVKVKPKENSITGNLVIYTASSGDQTSLPYKDKQHGMFTYFLLKKIQESKGDITYKELNEYIKNKVQLNSVIINSKDQNPDILISPIIFDKWEKWKLK